MNMDTEDFDPRNLNENKESRIEQTATTNEEGGEAYEAFTPEFALFKQVINNLLEDTYYQDADEQLHDVIEAFDRVADENPEFPLQLAAYARHEEGLRDLPQVLLVLSAYDERTKYYVRDYTPTIIDRTDEFNTVVSLALNMVGKNPNKPLKKGIEDALHQKYGVFDIDGETERYTWIEPNDGTREMEINLLLENGVDSVETLDTGYVHDEYTFTKYQQRDKDVSIHDVINLVRPNPRSENRDEMFGRIVRGELDDYPDVDPLREERTWESTRSDDSDDRDEAEQWRDRLDDMGLMARVRNLRNMKQAGLSGEEIFDYDSGGFGQESERLVREHQMFPFRFYQAYRACGEVSIGSNYSNRAKTFDIGKGQLLDNHDEWWLNEAIDASVQNLPDTLENTFTAVDLSGSMDGPINGNSEMKRAEIATLFGAMLMKRNSGVGAFGSDFALVESNPNAIENTGTLTIANEIYKLSEKVANATDGWKALKWATEHGVEYDRFVMFTDEQIWDSSYHGLLSDGHQETVKKWWDEYQNEVNPDAQLYIIDLASYGDLSMPEGYNNVHQISGWSSNVVEFIDKNEKASDVVSNIEAVGPDTY